MLNYDWDYQKHHRRYSGRDLVFHCSDEKKTVENVPTLQPLQPNPTLRPAGCLGHQIGPHTWETSACVHNASTSTRSPHPMDIPRELDGVSQPSAWNGWRVFFNPQDFFTLWTMVKIMVWTTPRVLFCSIYIFRWNTGTPFQPTKESLHLTLTSQNRSHPQPMWGPPRNSHVLFGLRPRTAIFLGSSIPAWAISFFNFRLQRSTGKG